MATLVTTHSLNNSTDCRLLDLVDVTLACEDANSILVEVVTVDAETRVDNSLVQIWYFFVQTLSKMFGQDFEDEVSARFGS